MQKLQRSQGLQGSEEKWNGNDPRGKREGKGDNGEVISGGTSGGVISGNRRRREKKPKGLDHENEPRNHDYIELKTTRVLDNERLRRSFARTLSYIPLYLCKDLNLYTPYFSFGIDLVPYSKPMTGDLVWCLAPM